MCIIIISYYFGCTCSTSICNVHRLYKISCVWEKQKCDSSSFFFVCFNLCSALRSLSWTICHIPSNKQWLHHRHHVDQSRAGQKMMKMLIAMMTKMATVISPIPSPYFDASWRPPWHNMESFVIEQGHL